MVAGICCFGDWALEVGVVALTSVAAIGMTVTVDWEVTGGLEDDATVASTRELEDAVSTGVEVDVDSVEDVSTMGAAEEVEVDADSVEDVSTMGAAEDVEEATVTPVRTVEVKLWLEADSALEAGNTRLDDGTSAAVLPCPGVTVTVTIGFDVTVTTPESHGSEPAASMLEPPGLPTLTPTSA